MARGRETDPGVDSGEIRARVMQLQRTYELEQLPLSLSPLIPELDFATHTFYTSFFDGNGNPKLERPYSGPTKIQIQQVFPITTNWKDVADTIVRESPFVFVEFWYRPMSFEFVLCTSQKMFYGSSQQPNFERNFATYIGPILASPRIPKLLSRDLHAISMFLQQSYGVYLVHVFSVEIALMRTAGNQDALMAIQKPQDSKQSSSYCSQVINLCLDFKAKYSHTEQWIRFFVEACRMCLAVPCSFSGTVGFLFYPQVVLLFLLVEMRLHEARGFSFPEALMFAKTQDLGLVPSALRVRAEQALRLFHEMCFCSYLFEQVPAGFSEQRPEQPQERQTAKAAAKQPHEGRGTPQQVAAEIQKPSAPQANPPKGGPAPATNGKPGTSLGHKQPKEQQPQQQKQKQKQKQKEQSKEHPKDEKEQQKREMPSQPATPLQSAAKPVQAAKQPKGLAQAAAMAPPPAQASSPPEPALVPSGKTALSQPAAPAIGEEPNHPVTSAGGAEPRQPAPRSDGAPSLAPLAEREFTPEQKRFLEQLSRECIEYHTNHGLSEEDERTREIIRAMLEEMIATQLKVSVYMFGSSGSGFGTKKGDMDLCVVAEGGTTLSKIKKILQSFGDRDSHYVGFENLFIRGHARVPVMGFTLRLFGHHYKCDMSLDNTLGVHNTRLLRTYSQCDPRVKPLVTTIKHWAKEMDLSDASMGTLSSYGHTLMVLAYLQVCQVVPNLQKPPYEPEKVIVEDRYVCSYSKEPSKWFVTPNRQSVGELLLGFFEYYSTFDFSRNVISIRAGAPFRCGKGGETELWNAHDLYIEDPFKPEHNLGSALRKKFMGDFEWSYKDTYDYLMKFDGSSPILPRLFNPELVLDIQPSSAEKGGRQGGQNKAGGK